MNIDCFKIFGCKARELADKFNNILPNELKDCFTIKENCLDSLVKINDSCIDKSFFLRTVYKKFYNDIYTEGNYSLSKIAYDYLAMKNVRISIAESLTGGLICSELVSNDGISKFLTEGIVSYSNDSKAKRLNVSETELSNTAVSQIVAKQMVEGLLMNGYCDIGVSTTGYASKCDNFDCKVGLNYIAVGDSDKIDIYENVFDGTRNEIRQKTANAALFYLIKKLKDSFDVNEYTMLKKE